MRKDKFNKSSPGPDDAPLLLEVPLFNDFDEIIHAFTTRKGGYSKPPYDSLNLSVKGGDEESCVEKNIARLEDFLFIDSPLFFLDQVHGNDILMVDDLEDKRGTHSFDAAITSEADIPLVILTADCLPILLFDPVRTVIAAVHAGWKGTSMQIVERTVEKMKDRFGSDPARIVAAMGPSIGPCCYEVDSPVMSAFEKLDSYTHEQRESLLAPVQEKEGRWMFDLAEANRLQLLKLGLTEDNICRQNHCTSCRGDLFYSYRRDGKSSGRQGALIMLKKDSLPGK